MAIASIKVSAVPDENLEIVDLIQEPRESTFTALIPDTRSTTLLKYIEGSNWTTNYYGSLLNKQSPVNHLDELDVDLSKSYSELKDCVLKVTSSVSPDYDESTGITRLIGTATMSYTVTPNVGDFFIANVDKGEDAVFIVTRTQRLTQMKNTPYSFDFTLYGYLNDDPSLMERIRARVQSSYVFDNYVGSLNKNVMFTENEFDIVNKLRGFSRESKLHYFKRFYQENTNTLSIPGETKAVVDPMIIDFIFSTVDVSKFSEHQIHVYSTTSHDYKVPSILDCILRGSYDKHDTHRKYAFFESSVFVNRASFNTPQFVFLDYMLHPVGADRNGRSDIVMLSAEEASYSIVNDKNNYDLTGNEIKVNTSTGEITAPKLPQLFIDNDYIVTDYFYELMDDGVAVEGVSQFELLLSDFLTKKKIPNKDLLQLVSDWRSWSPLHQFYMLPVIWLFIKVNLGEA